MEEVEWINMVIVHPNQRAGLAQHNLYAMKVNQGNRNCYSCRGFGHLARNCRSRGARNRIGKRKRLEYKQRMTMEGNHRQNNLNREEDLVVLD